MKNRKEEYRENGESLEEKKEEMQADAGKGSSTGQKKEKKKKSWSREITEDLFLILFVILAVTLIQRYLIVNADIPSASMEDTIMTGDRVFGNRVVYYTRDPERGEIVIFRYPDDEMQLFIKRVIGLPGETIEIRDGKVYINGSDEPLDEPYLKETPVGDFGPYEIPEDSYFMMGDNRNNSMDSRMWENTCVKRDKILAKAVFRYYPFSKIGFIE